MNKHESRAVRTGIWARNVTRLLALACICLTIAWSVYWLRSALVEVAQIVVANVEPDVSGPFWILASVVGVGVLIASPALSYGRRQRRLRLDTIVRMGARIRQLEAQLDPERSSSGLSSSGETPEEEGDQ